MSGSYVLVTQSLPISARIEVWIPHPTTAQSTRGMLSLVEGCPFPPWTAHQYLWVAKGVTYASLGQGSRAEGVPSAGRQAGEAEIMPCGPVLKCWSTGMLLYRDVGMQRAHCSVCLVREPIGTRL